MPLRGDSVPFPFQILVLVIPFLEEKKKSEDRVRRNETFEGYFQRERIEFVLKEA